MTAPVPQAVGTAVAGTGDVVASWPTHDANDIGLLFVEHSEATNVSTPSGWAIVPGLHNSGFANTNLSIFWKRAASSAEGSVTVTDPGDHLLAVIATVRGADTSSTPFNGNSVNSTNAANPHTITGKTTTVDDCLVISASAVAFATGSDNFQSWSNATLSSFGQWFDVNTLDGNDGALGAATGVKATAGASGNTTYSDSSGGVRARHATFAVKPVGTITGSLSATEAADTASISGDVYVSGSVAAVEAADTASVSGDVYVTGALAATESGVDVAAFTGTVGAAAIFGVLAATESADAVSATGSVLVQGALAGTESADSASVAGVVLVQGALAAAESADSASASGGIYVTGGMHVIEGADEAAVVGAVLVSGILAASEVADTMSATGFRTVKSGFLAFF